MPFPCLPSFAGKVGRLDGYAAFAYDSAWLLEQALNKINGPITRESIQQA